MADLSMTEARRRFGTIVRRAASDHERTTITERGRPAAVLVGAAELADLEEALALAEHRARVAGGAHRPVGQAQVRARLGLPAA
jgi:prevent-host-death family protein